MEVEQSPYTPEEKEAVERLAVIWRDTVWGLDGEVESADLVFENIVNQYRTGEGRAYHNILHIDRMLSFLVQFIHLSSNPAALVAAVFGHDIVYEPGSKINEFKSAFTFGRILDSLGVSERQINEVKRLIRITENHKTTNEDTDGKLLIDADYEILASPDDVYDRYSQRGIYVENVLSGRIPLESYKRGRGMYLDGWAEDAKNDRLFLNPEIMSAFKDQALSNFAREKLFLETL